MISSTILAILAPLPPTVHRLATLLEQLPVLRTIRLDSMLPTVGIRLVQRILSTTPTRPMLAHPPATTMPPLDTAHMATIKPQDWLDHME